MTKLTAVKGKREEPAVRREVPAVRRACSVLWLLARHAEGLPLARIARELEIIPSTCLQILRELAAARFVSHDPGSKRYRLGGGVLSLGLELTQQNPFVQAAQPHLNRLSREFGVGASGQERDAEDDLLVVLASSVIPGDLVSAGARRPLFTSASGRLMAAFGNFTETELRRGFSRVEWQTPPTWTQWLGEVAAARQQGYATDEAHFRKGLTAIAAPVANSVGRVDRAISVTAISAQLDPARRKKLVAELKRCAAEISQALR